MKKKTGNSTKHGLKNYQHPDKYGDWLGYEIKRLDRKKFEAHVAIELREDHLSPAGRVHGGVVAGFFDFACGAATFSSLGPDDFCSTVELKVNYFRPLYAGDKLKAVARVVFRGKRLAVVHANLHRGREQVGMATATFNIVSADRK